MRLTAQVRGRAQWAVRCCGHGGCSVNGDWDKELQKNWGSECGWGPPKQPSTSPSSLDFSDCQLVPAPLCLLSLPLLSPVFPTSGPGPPPCPHCTWLSPAHSLCRHRARGVHPQAETLPRSLAQNAEDAFQVSQSTFPFCRNRSCRCQSTKTLKRRSSVAVGLVIATGICHQQARGGASAVGRAVLAALVRFQRAWGSCGRCLPATPRHVPASLELGVPSYSGPQGRVLKGVAAITSESD